MRLSWLALLVPTALVFAGGTIIAARAGDDTTTITACARLKDGRLRVSAPDEVCRRKERPLVWSIQGEPGPVGSTGPTGPAGTTLAAGGFYLLGGSGYAGTATADQTFGTAIAATGGSIGVREPGGTLFDAVAYGTAANGLGEGAPAPAPPTTASPGSSAVRLPDGRDSQDNAADFSVTAVPTPKAANVAG